MLENNKFLLTMSMNFAIIFSITSNLLRVGLKVEGIELLFGIMIY